MSLVKRRNLYRLTHDEALNVIQKAAINQAAIDAGQLRAEPCCWTHGGSLPKPRCIVCIAEKELSAP